MYGKVFESMYDGTLAGHWQAIVTMQQLIVLANEDGVVDMTAEAIARRTTIPLKIITAGIEHLERPDPLSRTPGEEGRRIELLDEHRPWGWRLVNFGKYRALRNMEQKREADRSRQAEKRRKNKSVAIGSPIVQEVAHTDAYTDTEAKKKSNGDGRAVALPGWLPVDAWQGWLEVRKKNRAPNTVRALELAIGVLAKLKDAGNDPREVLEKSTLRGWRGLFPLDDSRRPKEIDFDALAKKLDGGTNAAL